MKKGFLWSQQVEVEFFRQALKSFATPEQLFYKLGSEFYAYIPKKYPSQGQTLQSRNALIGQYSEKWCQSLLAPIAKKFGLYAVSGVVCPELGMPKKSSADLAFCLENKTEQKPHQIKLIFEIKMSIVENYRYLTQEDILWEGHFNFHRGTPSLLRSDSMLKAIGKAINIRVSGNSASKIPILVLGNSPISKSYISKVDFLKQSGVIQGFWSLYPDSDVSGEYCQKTPNSGFQTIQDIHQLSALCGALLAAEFNYFSSMLPKWQLGRLIQIANLQKTEQAIAEKFLSLLKENG